MSQFHPCLRVLPSTVTGYGKCVHKGRQKYGLLDRLLETPCPQVLPIQARSRLFLVWPQIISLDLRAVCNNFRKKKLDFVFVRFCRGTENSSMRFTKPPPLRFSLPPGPPGFLPNKRNLCHPNLAINDV